MQFTVVVDIPHCLLQDEGYCTLIYSIALEVRNIDKTHGHRLEDLVVQLLEAVIHIGCK